MTLLGIATAFCGLTAFVHVVSVAVAAYRCRVPARHLPPASGTPPVTIVRPVCGIENFVEETLESTFRLDYPAYEILFCVASPADPVIPVVEDLMRRHPAVPARLLIGNDPVSANPKLNNCVKGWHAAAHDWVAIADSNVLMPADYLQRLLATWRADTGLVCAPPVGSRPDGFWAEVECAFLNTYQARAQYVADTMGLGFAQGKTLFWRRDVLEAGGGLEALGADVAEDAASTKLVRGLGWRVRLADAPFEQPLGRRRAAEVWRRQSRWARLRRACFPLYFLPEILTGGVFPGVAFAAAVHALGGPVLPLLLLFWLAWYGLEMALARAAGWHVSRWYPLHGLLRDLMLPALWLDGLLGQSFEWRGNEIRVAADSRAT
ncbi:ceramide glucosyltransferase [Rhodoplanes sp. TEM]|uniref:Ceramide glucosyltransferase n=1 Tax=Rhodoplanes tepidamans TaxID=200616 RepID=A0ABT5JAI4_RHOTP|nr:MULTISPECIES: ceramide glucosyltransferase [Rhodoplanes]MDC7786647.1 ceramide glucosyltransferase [Rhodoplanes tepidamans]MDC7983006.1 ceramide glucosyltransferase [Rhodoplanes sp. TEM]MDQ0356388.1 ceramide glucosyltransferase [Rhodoplanes tepidamans]